MRSTFLAILMLACAGVVEAQAPPGPAEAPVAVLKHSWAKERINWEGDPFGGPVESFEDTRRRRIDERRVERAKGSGNIGEAAKVEREMRAEQVIKARPPEPPRYTFLYRGSFKNLTEKAISEIDWDYVFYDAVTREEIGRRQFTSVESIKPGKTREVSFPLNRPPAQRISVYALDKKEREGMVEEVVVTRVQYADGTFWQRP